MPIREPDNTTRQPPPRRWCLAAFAAALALAALTRGEVLTDWDSWDYAWMALRQEPSGLCLGRWWFIFLMRLSWLGGSALGLAPARGFVAMQWSVALMSAAGVTAMMAWTWHMTRSRAAAVAAAVACLLISPSLVAYLSAVMTEGPTLLFIALTMLCWEVAVSRRTEPLRRSGGLACLGGACFGVAVSMREPALLLAAWPLVDTLMSPSRRRWQLLALAMITTILSLAVAVLMAQVWSGDPPLVVLANYAEYMRRERATYGFTPLANVGYLVLHFASASPIGLAALAGLLAHGLLTRLRRHPSPPAEPPAANPQSRRRLRALALSCLPYLLMSWYNPNLSFNYRLLLPLAALLGPLLGWATVIEARRLADLFRRGGRPTRWALTIALLGLALLIAVGSFKRLSYHFSALAQNRRLYRSMRELPEVAAVFPGPGSAIGLYLVHTRAKPYWTLYPNTQEASRWTPEMLDRRIQRLLQDGVPVYVKAGRSGWTRADGPNPEWKAISGLLARRDVADAPGPFVRILPRKRLGLASHLPDR